MSIAVNVGEISEAGSPYGTGYRVVWFLLRSERKNSLFFSCNFHDLISEQIHSLVSKNYNTIYGIQKNTFLTPKQLSCPTTMASYMGLNILHLQETYILCIFCDLHIGFSVYYRSSIDIGSIQASIITANNETRLL